MLNRLTYINKQQTQADSDRSGEGLARLFKYYRLLKDPRDDQTESITLNRISAKAFYKKHKLAFDRLSDFFTINRLDVRPYIKFFVYDMAKSGRDIDEFLYSKEMLSKYADKLQILKKKKNIYDWFMKSVSNIVDMCIERNYMSGKDCILNLIRDNKLCHEYVAGRISKYFFAALPKFKEIIPKLDYFSKLEFSELYDKFDIYNTEINSVFLRYKNRVVNPLEIVNSELLKKRNLKIKAANR